MRDIINPWGALRNAKIITERQARRIGDLYEEIDAHKERIANLKAIIAQGHFRNPKTGCIGPKGKTYK
jgi:hypothetical protein